MSSLHVSLSNNSGFEPSRIYIGFHSGVGGPSTIIHDLKTKKLVNVIGEGATSYPYSGNWYLLSDLAKGINVESFSGRIYICYGTPWSVQYENYEPAQSVTDPNFYLRYDKMELTYTGQPSDVADLTSIDYWSIPMSLTTKKKGSVIQEVSGLLGGASAQSVFDTLSALTTPPVSGLVGPGGANGKPLPATVPGDFVKEPNGPEPTEVFSRVIGPSSYPPCYPLPGAIPVMPYDTMQHYLDYLQCTFGVSTPSKNGLGNGKIGTIKGQFSGVGPNVPPLGPKSKQSYDLIATIDSSLAITLTGTVSGSGQPVTTMKFSAEDINNPSGFYGGNAPFTLNGSSIKTIPQNDVYGWICADLFAGMNIGALGSQTSIGTTMVGSMPSQQWFTDIPASSFFTGLQPNNPYYNQWAATLSTLSDAYNFAYTDRFAHVLISLNPADIDTLDIVLDDGQVAISA